MECLTKREHVLGIVTSLASMVGIVVRQAQPVLRQWASSTQLVRDIACCRLLGGEATAAINGKVEQQLSMRFHLLLLPCTGGDCAVCG